VCRAGERRCTRGDNDDLDGSGTGKGYELVYDGEQSSMTPLSWMNLRCGRCRRESICTSTFRWLENEHERRISGSATKIFEAISGSVWLHDSLSEGVTVIIDGQTYEFLFAAGHEKQVARRR